MTEDLFQDLSPEQRLEALKANAHSSELKDLERFFKDDEMEQMREEVAAIGIAKMDAEEEWDAKKKVHSTNMKGYTKSIKENLKNLKKGFIVENKLVFHFADQVEKIMVTYDQDGKVISSRKLRPSERQSKIVDLDQQKRRAS